MSTPKFNCSFRGADIFLRFSNGVDSRKNWLFSDSPAGAKSSAILYSHVESAKLYNLKPFNICIPYSGRFRIVGMMKIMLR